MRSNVFKVCFFVVTMFSSLFALKDYGVPIGWATQNGGVTGGGNATPKVVSTYEELKDALTSSSVRVIHVKGTITIPSGGNISMKDVSDKTIFGLPGSKLVSNDQTQSGSGILYMRRCKNIILRNLVFEGPGAYDCDGNDNLTVDECENIWVDHCEFWDAVDGNFDIKNQSNYISVTWCIFGYKKPPKAGGSGGSDDHRYSNLIGSSDNATEDRGKLNITFYGCWWTEGVRERMPRVRFGKVHLVNNLYSSSVSNYCIRAGKEANLLIEGNYFDNQKKPVDYSDSYGYTAIKAVNNYGCDDIIEGSAFTPPYTLDVADPITIVDDIKKYAGATLSSDESSDNSGNNSNNKAPTVQITSPSNNQEFEAPAHFTINANASDEDGTISKVDFYINDQLIHTESGAPYTFEWDIATAGTYTIKAVAYDDKNSSAEAIITVNIKESPLATTSVRETKNVLVVHPNPVCLGNGIIFYTLNKNIASPQLLIYDVLGNVIAKVNIGKEGSLSLNNLGVKKAGIYFAIIKSNNNVIAKNKFYLIK